MKVFLAGRVALESDGAVIEERRFPGRQARLLFAFLVCAQGRPVPRDELAEALWGERPPASWDKALTGLVSKLRGLLAEATDVGGDLLTTAFGCYRLALPEGSWVDVLAAASAAQEAEDALAAGDLEAARRTSSLAISLTQQTFLPAEDGGWVEAKRRELADVRTRALTVLADASLRAGDAAEAVRWADQTVALEPFNETGYRRLMQAHAAAGNRAEALRVYERCRTLLADELGAYPSPETASLHRSLLAASTSSSREGRQRPIRDRPTNDDREVAATRRLPIGIRDTAVRIAAIALTLGVAAAISFAVVTTRGAARRVAVSANSLAALAPSGQVVADVPVGDRPDAISSSADSLWVANFDDGTVSEVDPSSPHVVRTIPIGSPPSGLTETRNDVWVSNGAGDISRIDRTYNRVSSTPAVTSSGSGFSGTSAPRPLLSAFGSVWIVDPNGLLDRVDPESARTTGSVDVGNAPSAIAAGAGSVWVTNRADGTVTRIDPTTLLATTIPVGHGPTTVAVDAGGAWVGNAGDDTVVRIDPATNAIAASTRVGLAPAALLQTPGALWVANAGDGTVMRLNSRTGAVTETIRLGGAPDALAFAAGRVWVSLAPAPPPPPAAGGVAHFTLQADLPSYDPALSRSPGFFYATCANLVTYPDKAAPEGSRIVPEVAQAVPTPTDGGRAYAFAIRPGFRFSPPSNQTVTATTFKATIERVTDPRLKSPWASEFSGIVGYRAYVTGKARHLAGLIARGRTLTIRLSQPNGSLLAWLASGAACAVPSGTPPEQLDHIPSAGPYYIASYTPRQQLVLRRNPNYHGERPHRLAEIVFTIGVDPSRALAEIDTGKADYAFDGLPRGAGPELQVEYGPGSAAAKAGHQQYFINRANAERYLHMNTSRPLFSHARLRRAVNYALDRSVLVAQARRFAEVNPFNAGTPTDNYLPPTIAGTEATHLYPLNGPHLEQAQRLAGHLHATATMYTPNVPPWLQEAQIIRRDLKPLGIDVEIKEMPLGEFFDRIGRRGEPFDLAVSGWQFQTADPGEVLSIFDGRTIRPTGNSNFSYFDDPGFDRKLAKAAQLSGPRRYRAYSRLALELQRDLVPAAAIATDASRDFFSARIGCQLYQPVYGIDLAALCLKR